MLADGKLFVGVLMWESEGQSTEKGEAGRGDGFGAGG